MCVGKTLGKLYLIVRELEPFVGTSWEKVLKLSEIDQNNKQLVGKLCLIFKGLQPFVGKQKKAWENFGKTIIDNQYVITIFGNFVGKTFFDGWRGWYLRNGGLGGIMVIA